LLSLHPLLLLLRDVPAASWLLMPLPPAAAAAAAAVAQQKMALTALQLG
jgi:hypothetical protein